MTLSLPTTDDVDGGMLSDFANHSAIRSMITRSNMYWPSYGVMPQMYGLSGKLLRYRWYLGCILPRVPSISLRTGHGFQEVFSNDLMMALELGLFEYARGILANWLSNYLRRNGSIFYRGLEMHQQGRLLTLLALYHSYTGDAGLLLEHSEKVEGVIAMLRERRARALRLPKTDPAWGMPVVPPNAASFPPLWSVASLADDALLGGHRATMRLTLVSAPLSV